MTSRTIDGAMMTDDDVLRLAAQVLGNPLLFEDLKEDFTVHTEAKDWIKFARALLSASKPAAPEGWKLVPVQLTHEMHKAADDAGFVHIADFGQQQLWQAELAASPAAPAQSGEPVAFRQRVERLLVELHSEDRLSEGQCAKVLDIHRIEWRKIADDAALAAPQPSQPVEAGEALTESPKQMMERLTREFNALSPLQRYAIERNRAASSAVEAGRCATCQDGTLLPQYGVAPHDCYHKLGKSIGQSEVHSADAWPSNFEVDSESNGECGVFHCPACGPKFKAGKPVSTVVLDDERTAGLGLEVTSVNYSVELSIEQFKKIDAMDFLDIVNPRMVKAGAEKVEFNGHFGPYVFFTSTEEDAPAVLAVVCDLLGAKARAASLQPVAQPVAQTERALPVAGETWFVKIRDAGTLSTLEIIEVSAGTVLVANPGSHHRSRFEIRDLNFIKRLTAAHPAQTEPALTDKQREAVKKAAFMLKIFAGHDSGANLMYHFGKDWRDHAEKHSTTLRALLIAAHPASGGEA